MKKFTVTIGPNTTIKATNEEAIFTGDNIEVRDEYHSMKELYEHRMALNIALFKTIHIFRHYPGGPQVFKTKLHSDGTMFEGYFMVMLSDRDLGQISYHYKLEHWDKFKIPEVERAPEYDGHTSQDVIERLMKL